MMDRDNVHGGAFPKRPACGMMILPRMTRLPEGADRARGSHL